MRLIISLLLNAVCIFLAAWLLPGVSVDGFGAAVIVSIVLGLINFFIKPILFILTLPITIITLGLFMLIINAAVVLLADNLIDGFFVDGWLWAILFSIVLAILNALFGVTDREKE
jgi:putative membrane protein